MTEEQVKKLCEIIWFIASKSQTLTYDELTKIRLMIQGLLEGKKV